MKKLIAVSLMLSCAFIYGQDFIYSLKSNIKNTANVGFILNPIDFDVQVGGALSGGIIVSNMFELVSAEINLGHYYASHSYNATNRRGYMPISYEELNVRRLDFRFGINFLQKREMEEDYQVTLKSSGNTRYVSAMPCEVVTSYAAKVGFLSRGFFSKEDEVDFPGSTAKFDNALLYQTSNVLSIGVSRKLSVETTFETDKYGEVNEFVENELYFDVLLSIGNNVSDVERLVYGNSAYPNEPSSSEPLSLIEQIDFQEFHKSLPIGVRFGARVSGRKMHNVTYNIYGGVYPRTYNGDPINILNAGLSIGYRFLHKL